MTEKCLGKITSAEFGTVRDYPFLMGLQLHFSLNGGSSGIGDGGKYTVNIGPDCKWSNPEDRAIAVTQMVDWVRTIFKDAKVGYVSDLVGKPVEVTLENNCFKDFRILKEVL